MIKSISFIVLTHFFQFNQLSILCSVLDKVMESIYLSFYY